MKRTVTAILAFVMILSVMSSCKRVEQEETLPTVTKEIREGCFLTLSLDRDSYEVGDVVAATFTVENRSADELTLYTDRGGIADFREDPEEASRYLFEISFYEGGYWRRDLGVWIEFYNDFGYTLAQLQKGESLSRTEEMYLDTASDGIAPPVAAADWKIVASVRACGQDRSDGTHSHDDFESYAIEIDVPHDRGDANPSYSANSPDGCSLTAVLGKAYYDPAETVTAEVTFKNGGDVPVRLLCPPDGKMDFDASVIRTTIDRYYSRAEYLIPYSEDYMEHKLLAPGESYTVKLDLGLDRNDVGRLMGYDASNDYTLVTQAWYIPDSEGASPKRCAVEMNVPHSRMETTTIEEAKAAYFSRIRATLDGTEFSVGDKLGVTAEYYAIRGGYYLEPFADGNIFKVQLLDGDTVVDEKLLMPSAEQVYAGIDTVLSAQTEFDTSGLSPENTWTVVITVMSYSETDGAAESQEYSVRITVPQNNGKGEPT